MDYLVYIFLLIQIHSIGICFELPSGFSGTKFNNFSRNYDSVVENESIYFAYLFVNSTHSGVVSEIIQLTPVPVIVITSTNNKGTSVSSSSFNDNFVFVMITDDLEHIPIIIENQIESKTILERSKTVAITTTYDDNSEPIRRMFIKLWKMNVLNVILMSSQGGYMSTYNPYMNKFYINLTESHKISFEDKTRNMYGNTLYVPLAEVVPKFYRIWEHGTWKWSGECVEILEPLGKFYNANVALIIQNETDFGFERRMNETHSVVNSGTGSIIHSRRGDLTLIERTFEVSNLFDFIYPTDFGGFVCLVPKAEKWPALFTLYHTLNTSTKIFIFSVGLLVFLCIRCINYFKGSKTNSCDIILLLFAIFTNQSYDINSSVTSAKVIAASWRLFSLVVVATFTNQIVAGLVSPKYFSDIDNPEDALRIEEWVPLTYTDLAGFLKRSGPGTKSINDLLQRRLVGLPRNELYELVRNPSRKYIFVVSGSVANYILEETKSTNAYHKTKPWALQILSNIVAKGSIFYHSFNTFNMLAFESGLQAHWETASALNHSHRIDLRKKDMVLKMEHIGSIFIILGFGFMIATIGFFTELLVSTKAKKLVKIRS